jgi:hypothetical protein
MWGGGGAVISVQSKPKTLLSAASCGLFEILRMSRMTEL